ncbi:methyltransferase [Rhizobium changzhiense]|uniref:class I SAM-dependent methyltransferase n=1 Tax=Rhizobium changzhiense TaxID=2692317 RepID=UPI001F0C18F5|nr:methyltransferase [Rhizobium changzhiense]MCH4547465.1 methyltransferase [Rhizobium changzhiense]
MIDTEIHGVKLRLNTSLRGFSPKAIDPGTSTLLSLVKIGEENKVLDLGCGYGVVGIFAARFTNPMLVHMVDIDPEMVRLAKKNAEANGVSSVNCCISDGFDNVNETGFDLILSNPPYHVDFSVPKKFIEKGFNRLAIGGSLWMVVKRQAWYENKLRKTFGGVKIYQLNGYCVLQAERRSYQRHNSR